MNRVLIILSIYFTCSFIYADVPVRNEELIFNILNYDGNEYSGTFCSERNEIIYLLADVNNFISPRKVFVYFWPITEDLRTDTSVLHKKINGSLEIWSSDDKDEIEKLDMREYTYFLLKNEYEENWHLLIDNEAEEEWNRHQALEDGYLEEITNYKNEIIIFNAIIKRFTENITSLKEKGEDISVLVEELNSIVPPEMPVRPEIYKVPPIPLQTGFLINKPEGEFYIRLRDEDGNIYEGSEKKVVIFNKTRVDSIGFDIITSDDWTHPLESNESSSVIYVNGSSDIYLRPFLQMEYNDLFYEKMMKNDGFGNQNLYKWIKIKQIPDLIIESDSIMTGKTIIEEESYFVDQRMGSSLGYEIVVYEPEGIHKDRTESFKGYRIDLLKESRERVIKIRSISGSGDKEKETERQIRIVKDSEKKNFIYIILFVPFLTYLILRNYRKHKY